MDDPSAVANAQNWLRLVCHVLTCDSPACVLDEQCANGKRVLLHTLFSCPEPAACASPSCLPLRRLALHWLRCQADDCRLCTDVWRDLSGFTAGGDGRGEPAVAGVPSRQLSDIPPEAPGTPPRTSVELSGDGVGRAPAALAAAAEAAAADGPGGDGYAPQAGLHARVAAAGYEPHPLLPRGADRAVAHLQEATTYLRYLLQTFMNRNTRDAPSSAPGREFWFAAFSPALDAAHALHHRHHHHHHHQQQVPQQQFMAFAGPAGPGYGGGGDLVDAAPAALAAVAVGAPARMTAGRRLVQHRLMCRNPHCALCAGTCGLFTRGQALRQQPVPPGGLGAMDDIVQELSLALNNIAL